MAALETTSAEARERIERIGEADLVVALPSCHSAEILEAAVAGLRPVLPALLPNGKIVVLHPDSAIAVEPQDDESPLQLVACPMSPVERYDEPSLAQGLRSLLTIGKTLGARAFIMLGSEPAATIPEGLRYWRSRC